LTAGISPHCQNIIAHTIVTSITPKANNNPTQSNFNTNTSPILLSHPSITHADKVMNALAECIKAIQGMTGNARNSQVAQDLQRITADVAEW
jgi:hypothetical protein